MNNVMNYLNDGANWQARCVLANLGSVCFDEKSISLDCGRYENGREQGYVFTARMNGKQRNYAVYEHRNSDDLCIVVNDAATFGTPQASVMYGSMNDKYDVTKSFQYGQILECGMWIYNDIEKWAKELSEAENEAC